MARKKTQQTERKYQLERVKRALAWAQRRLLTSYDLTVDTDGVPDGAVLAISRTSRGTQDAQAFMVYVNVDAIRTLSIVQLRALAGHECIHAILFPIHETLPPLLAESTHDAVESATYTLQRALFGDFS